MDYSKIASQVRTELKKHSDVKRKQTSQNFFKEKIKSLGVKTSMLNKISREIYKKIAHLEKKEIFSLCEILLKTGYIEETIVAFRWSEQLSKHFVKSDFTVLEEWQNNYVTNWAACDTFCNQTLGNFIFAYPEYIEKLKQWTQSENRWLRRGAAVTLIVPARRGLFLKDVLEISSLLMNDNDDLVQKGYGWLLKEASKKHQQEIFNYVLKNKEIMPRTALRYAIEKMPEDLRKEAMKK